MAKPKCPKCGREATYNAKYDQCSACGRGYEAKVQKSGDLPLDPTFSSNSNVGEPLVTLTPGEPCPTCGKPVGKTPAERQREYRERKKDGRQGDA